MNTTNDSNNFNNNNNSSSSNRHSVDDTCTEIQKTLTSPQAMFLHSTGPQVVPDHSSLQPVWLKVLIAGDIDSQAVPGNWTEREGVSGERGDIIQDAAQVQTERVALRDMQGLL